MTSHSDLIAALLAVDPVGLGGVWLRARHGPRRQALADALQRIEGTHCRVMPEAGETEVFGGIDLTQSLFQGKLSRTEGVLGRSDVVWLSRAERLEHQRAARIAAAMESGSCGIVILCDEAAEDDERPAASLIDRLAFFLCDMTVGDDDIAMDTTHASIGAARKRLTGVTVPDDLLTEAVQTTSALGCVGSRAALHLLRAARAFAALDGADNVETTHLALVAPLVLAHRIRTLPEVESPDDNQPTIESEEDERSGEDTKHSEDAITDLVLEAAKVTLPGGLLAAMMSDQRGARGSGEGSERISAGRGRPLPSRSGSFDGRRRLDLLATLQSAAPWQKLRGADPRKLVIHKSDLRLRRFKERSERMLIFVVDASGSAAMARLAEAKGAAECLLAEAYRSRDHVSLITFRGDGADCALEPTRSLVRAKRLLGGLPGGGATPLASALREAALQAALGRKKGLTPQVILMTDGRANRTLDGRTDRAAAHEEAIALAGHVRAQGLPVLVVDSGMRPSRELGEIARALGSEIIRLPRGHSGRPAETLMAALDT